MADLLHPRLTSLFLWCLLNDKKAKACAPTGWIRILVIGKSGASEC